VEHDADGDPSGPPKGRRDLAEVGRPVGFRALAAPVDARQGPRERARDPRGREGRERRRRRHLHLGRWRSRASRFAAFVQPLLDLGYSPVSFDAPAHGSSGGGRVAATILDHQRIFQALAAKYGTFEGVIAHSLGVPFILYAVREGVAAKRLVTISGPADFRYLTDSFCRELGLGQATNQALRDQIERRYFPGIPDIWTKFSISTGELDLLVIHNDTDDVVDPAQAERVLTQYGPKARFVQTTGLGHRRIIIDPDVITEAVTFLASEESKVPTSGSSDATVPSDSDVAERLDLGA
jgi:hypothetical protein